MAVTRINNNQISDASAGNAYVGINASTKIQPYSITATKIANNLTYGSDLTITGNLTVQGNTTAIDTTYTTIEDPVILLASTQTGAPSVDIGFIGERGTSDNIAFVWDESADEFVTAFTSSTETNTTITISSYASLKTLDTTVTGNLSTAGFATVTGNITGGNVNSNAQMVATGNITGGNLITAGQVVATGNVTGGNLITAGLVSATGNIVSSANINGANINASANVVSVGAVVTGNITGGNVLTAGLISATGNITGGNLNTAGQVVATGNITGGNLITAGTFQAASISATGNISGGNLIAAANVNAVGGYFTGNVTVLGNLNATVGIVYANAGVFYGATPTGNGAIYGGITGYTPLGSNVVAQFAGNSNSYSQINFQNISNGTSASTDFIATADTGTDTTNYLDLGINSSTFNDQINYPGFGALDSYVHNHGGNLILNPESTGKTIKLMVGGTANTNVVGNISSTGFDITGVVTANGNISGGNLATTGVVTATGNITGGNVSTAGQVAATGNITGGNLVTSGRVVATGNIVSSANIAGGNLSVTGAINADTLNTAGNAVISGNLFVLGNITYNNVDDLRIQDPVIIMGTGPNGAPLTSPDSYDRGTFMEYYTSARGNAWMGWQNSSGNMIAAANVSFSGNDIIQVNAYGTFQAGNIYAQSAVTTGNITGGNVTTSGIVTATGNVTGGNIITAGLGFFGTTIEAVGNVQGGNLNTAGQVVASGNITGGNVTTAGQVTATGNVTGGNLVTPNLVSSATVIATGNITGGNLITAGLASVTGNITGGNLITAGQVVATGNVTGGNLITAGLASVTGNITGGNLITAGLGSFGTTVSVTGNITGGNVISNAQVVSTGNITGGNLNTAGQVVATGNITGGNLITAGLGSFGTTVTATGNITGGNLNTGAQVVATGNITGGNLNTAGQVVATGNITGGNLTTAGSGTFGNITISGSNVDSTAGRITFNQLDGDVDFAIDGDTTANVFYVDAGTGTISIGSSTQTTNAILSMNATNSFLMPVGNTAQRPATGVTGMLRFNSTTNGVEVYNASEWATVGTPSFTVISDEQFNGNGVAVSYTLANATTTNSTIVSINGVVQIPTIAYSVGGAGSNVLTFTEAPQTGDIIDVRALTTTTEVVAISNSPGNAVVATNPTSGIVEITGDLNPTANVTYNLGTASLRWKDLFLSGSSMTLGNIVMKNTSGNTVAFYGPDGTTPATIDSTNVDTTTITNGTSNVSVASSGGNVRFNIGGTSNVMVVQQSTVAITGDLSVTGNATLSGNILGDRVQNGTTSFDIQTASGNANITVAGTSNVAVFASTGLFVTGTLNVSGNIVSTGSNGVANIGSATTYFNTVHAKATSAQYADLAENYVADAEYAPGTVLSFGGDNEVTLSTSEGDRRIAGVVSTNPSYIMNSVLEAEHVATIALTGRVPTFVSGPVAKGDMMVSAGNGRAVACATPAIGTVIGKALENHAGGDGVIEVVVGRL